MKAVLTAVNAKFIHSSLALRSIGAYCRDFKENITIKEFTINNDEDTILRELFLLKADIIGFSCYIWNIDIIKKTIKNIRKLMPHTKIILGGPEVSYEFDAILGEYADIIVIGEGEKTFYELMDCFVNGKGCLGNINGIAYIDDNYDKIVTPPREPLSLDEIPFAYEEGLSGLENKIIYYEASRGCPYSCQYCLSSVEKGIRLLSLERVKRDLKFFTDRNVRQVKFVDRTFNADKGFALAVWNFLIENDNSVTNFHFEVSADILTDEMLDTLKRARKGLFQLEIGVQSTNDLTLSYIKRKTRLDFLFKRVKQINEAGNIHQHLDLIAGLPGEDYNSFAKSFNDVFSLKPQQLQLGFLKLLKGSGLRRDAEKYGIVYREASPYEVLYTKEVSFEEMLRLKRIEEMVENYYNSGKCVYTVFLSMDYFPSAFDFFERLSVYWEDRGADNVSHSKMELYEIMYDFLKEYYENDRLLKDILRFDILINDNLKNLPQWLDYKADDELKGIQSRFFSDSERVRAYLPKLTLYSPKQLNRMCCLEKFSADFCGWIDNGFKALKREDTYILFEYTSKSFNSGGICSKINVAFN